jgi:hypothetical protein
MQHTDRRSFGDNGVPANGNDITETATPGGLMIARSDRDDIADIVEHFAVVPTSDAEDVANAILSSDWLERHDASIAAKAWAEARSATMQDHQPPLSGFAQRANPYARPGH